MADSKHNYIWTIKNITKSPVFINDLPPNGLMIMNNEQVNLHDRFSLYILEDSKSLKNALNLGLIKTIRKEIYENNIFNVSNVSKKEESEKNDLRNEIDEIKSLLMTSMLNKSESISKNDLIEILSHTKSENNINVDEISNIVKKTVLETISNNNSTNIILKEEEINRKKYDNLDISTNFILNSKKIGENVQVNKIKDIDEKLIKDEGMDDLDQLADFME